MPINSRNKGRAGEQEVCRWLNSIAAEAYKSLGLPVPETPLFQRNQNQSAVGGSDITNPFGLSIEVKRHEQLAIDTWWKQCYEDASVAGKEPVLLYRQNGKRKWRAVMMLAMFIPNKPFEHWMNVRAEISHEDFEKFLLTWILESDIVGKGAG